MPKTDRPILFITYCWGAAGSTWLAWALNSHKDVFCLHAPNLPKINRHARKDVFTIVEAFYSQKDLGGTYKCVGFTHGIQREWHAEFVKDYGDHFRACILTRHPIQRIHSHTALWVRKTQSRRFTLREWLVRNRIYAKLATASGRRDFPKDAASLSFYHACHAVNRIDEEVAATLPIYRFEDMVGSIDKFQELLSFISNNTLAMAAEDIRELQGTVKGPHVAKRLSVSETYESWSDIQRQAFHFLVKPQTLLTYERLGYEFPEAIRRFNNLQAR